MKKWLFAFLPLLAIKCELYAQQSPAKGKQDYLDEPRPGNIPQLFAAARISGGLSTRDMAISPDGKELFYTVQGASGEVSVILYMHYSNGQWMGPEMAPFSGRYGDLEPAFSYDGKTLYFASNRPVSDPDGPLKDYDIWKVRKENGRWGTPIRLDTVINTSKNEFYPSIARSGNLYFTREMENGKGKEDIVISEWKDGHYQLPYSLPDAINTDQFEFNAFVDPDERYLLFSSFGRKDEIGGGDLYIACKNDQGVWQPAVMLDTLFNSKALDFSPFVTFDGQYLFYTSAKMKTAPPFKKPLTVQELRDMLGKSGSGLNHIYWVRWKPILKKYCHVQG